MPESAKALTEIVFNICYLIVVWGLVVAMIKRRTLVAEHDRGAAGWLLIAFAALALGDTGHVGFRVIAYAMGGLDTNITFFGRKWNLIAMGAIATAWTFTVYFVCMLFMWKERFAQKINAIAVLLLALAVVRAVIMLHPANTWDGQDIVEPWFTLRNVPLMVMQAGTAFLIVRDSSKHADTAFRWIGIMILVSLACYAAVIALVKTYPIAGMLMIPKTMAYLAIGIIGFKNLYLPR